MEDVKKALVGALKSKTVWFNALSIAVELTGAVAGVLPQGTLLVAVNTVNIVLRAVTTTALSNK